MSFPGPGPDHPVRKYPLAKVGDMFGPYTVTRLLPRGYKGRSDERVSWKCACGRTGSSWVFNLRAISKCHHKRATGRASLPIGTEKSSKQRIGEIRNG